ncbi:NADAR family protein [Streptomyces sp. JB150]|uniref:NADAR family protein n=1 Tax=Streptomyces sp. JB150 TaxID=2714844 RepID=UPI00140DEAA4|nr:NADAR family protein [Streptomyces sp. JB150]QIJ65014.1 NADAR family protein [Streptomyces sp. JB150]
MSVVAATLPCMEKIDSREALVKQVGAGSRVKYLYFWGHRPRPDGRIGPSCLSQWWPAPFTADGVEYATAEHWMMAAKARLFGDAEAERRVLAAAHPAEAKKAGRLVRGFDEGVWERERFGIVVEGSVRKFAAREELRHYLLGTGERVLVEASPVDRVWGIGLAADDEAAAHPERWRGLNLLGFALMEARDRLRAGTDAGARPAA